MGNSYRGKCYEYYQFNKVIQKNVELVEEGCLRTLIPSSFLCGQSTVTKLMDKKQNYFLFLSINTIIFFKPCTSFYFCPPNLSRVKKGELMLPSLYFCPFVNTFVHFCPNVFLLHFLFFMLNIS